MPDEETPLEPEDEDIEPSGEGDEPSDDDVDTDPVATLTAEVAALRAQVDRPVWLDELRTAQGRIRATEQRLERVEDPAERASLQRDLEQRLEDAHDLIATLTNGLDDTAFADPSVKYRAQAVIEERGKRRPAPATEPSREPAPAPANEQAPTAHAIAIGVFETEWEDRITDEGWNPDGTEWAPIWAQANAMLRDGKTLADARALMKNHLSSLKTERTNARRRNNAQRAGGAGAPRGTGVSVNALDDPNKSRDEKAALLRSAGIQVGPI